MRLSGWVPVLSLLVATAGAAPHAAGASQAAGAGASQGAGAAQAASARKAAGEARTVEITGTDNMKYDVTTIPAKRGESLRLVLKASGTMPKVAMLHNVVVLQIGADQMAFASAAATARATDYIPPAMQDQVIAHTPMAGNGETVEITFKVPAKAGSYPYLCTFPGHFISGMKGTLVVK